MNKTDKLIIAGAVLYAVAGLHTFGYRWHNSPHHSNEDERFLSAMVMGIIWPIYWPCKLAIKLWEPPAPVPVPAQMPQIPELNMVAPPKQLSMGGPDDILIFHNGMAVWINKTNIISYPTQ